MGACEDVAATRAQTAMTDDPKPHDILSDEGGSTEWWLASAWDIPAIMEEWDWRELTPDSLREVWMACRWTTEEERSDPDKLYDLGLGSDAQDVSVVYWNAEPEAPGAHRYWTTT